MRQEEPVSGTLRDQNETLFSQLESWSVRAVDPHGNADEGHSTPPASSISSPFHVEIRSIVQSSSWRARVRGWPFVPGEMAAEGC